MDKLSRALQTTLFYHHPVVVWIILGCSKLADKLGIYVRAYGSDEMRQCAAFGMREWVHLCMLTDHDGAIHTNCNWIAGLDQGNALRTNEVINPKQ